MLCDKIITDSIPANASTGIPEHQIKFLIKPSMFSKVNGKSNLRYRSFKHFNKENFKNRITNINW